MRLALAVLAAGLAATNSPALGQGTLTRSDQLALANAYYTSGGSNIGNQGSSPDTSGMDFAAIEDRRFTGGGFSGKGFAQHAVTFTPTSPLINGPFVSAVLEACTSAEIFTSRIGPHSYEQAYGLARGIIEFNLTATMNWTWIGAWQGASIKTNAYNQVSAAFTLIDLNSPTQYVNMSATSINGANNFSQSFSLSGTLGPGDYQLTWMHESYVAGGNTPFGFYPSAVGGVPLVSCVDSTFTLYPVPAPGAATLAGAGGLLALRRRR